MIPISRDNDTILRDRGLSRGKRNRSQDGSYITCEKRAELLKEKDFQPEFFVNFIPIASPSNWRKDLTKVTKDSVKSTINKLETIKKKVQQLLLDSQNKVTELLTEDNAIKTRILTYKGRGLNENRKMFYLISYLSLLRTKKEYLIISESDAITKHINAMINILNRPIHYENIIVSVDIEGYLAARVGLGPKIKRIVAKIKHLESYIKWPSFTPLPTEIGDQLIYPTAETYSMFKNMASNANTKSIEKIFEEFHAMTDDNEEFMILLDHSFDFGWQKADFPYLCLQPSKIGLFLRVTPRALNVDFIPEQFMDVPVNNLQGKQWPYKTVVDIIISILFELNPVRMARIFNSSLEEISICIDRLYPEHSDIDFDTVFSIAVLSVMASGILAEEKVLAYISQVSLLDISDSLTQVGATYAATALNHILSLDEEELTNIS